MHVCWFSRLSDDQLAGLRGGGAGSVELLLRPRADAATVLRKVDGSFARIRGVRLQGPTGVGEYRARAGMGLTAVIEKARAGFRQHHVVPPPLRGALVTVTAETAAQEQSRARRLLGRDLESVAPRIAQHVPGTLGGGERQATPGSTSAATTPALQSSWAPTEWRGRTYKYQRVGDRSYLASALDMVYGRKTSPSQNWSAGWTRTTATRPPPSASSSEQDTGGRDHGTTARRPASRALTAALRRVRAERRLAAD